MVFDDFFADCQPHAVTWVLSPGVQTLKNLENKLLVFVSYANPIVDNRKHPFFAPFFSGDRDSRRLFAAELNRIADQILKQLYPLKTISQNRGQRVTSNGYVVLFQNESQVLQDLFDRGGYICCSRRQAVAAGSRKCQQVFEQRLHASGALDRITDIPVGS